MRTFGAMRLVDGGTAWEVTACEPHVAIRMKQIFPRIPKANAPPWRFPNDPAHAADLEWFTGRYPLATSPADHDALTRGRLAFEQNVAAMERIFRADYQPPGFACLRAGSAVRAYQAQAVEMLMRAKGVLLGDEVGLGKTYTTAAACLVPGALPAIVVCHPHLQSQWRSVIESFTTLRAHAIKGTRPYMLPVADVLIYRYTQLVGWADTFAALGHGLVAFDEVQELRTGPWRESEGSRRGTAALRLAEAARMRLCLSATPIYNYGTELWNVMLFVRPDVLGSWPDFLREWTGGRGRINDPAALGTYLREQYAFLRRTKADVGQHMPAVNRIVDVVGHDAAAMQSIEDMARSLAMRTTVGEFTERGQAARDLDMLVRHQTGVAKAAQVADFARILVEGGSPVLLVGWHRDVYAIWNERLADLKPAMYTGSEPAARKNREKERFLAGETDVLIMSLRSGAGLDGLQQRCSTVVFGELDWSPGIHHQVIGRLDREGQTQPVTAIFLVTEEGSDPPMMEVLGLKAAEASRIVDPGLGVQAVHSDFSHVQRLVERYLARRGSAAA